MEHVYETVTPTDLLDDEPDGWIIIDCSCGKSYWTTSGGNEYGKIQDAQTRHRLNVRDH